MNGMARGAAISRNNVMRPIHCAVLLLIREFLEKEMLDALVATEQSPAAAEPEEK